MNGSMDTDNMSVMGRQVRGGNTVITVFCWQETDERRKQKQ